MNHYVYRTTCRINGKWYIGIRSCGCWPTDDRSYVGSGSAFIRAVKKYGRKEFTKEILAIVDSREQALRIEAALVTDRVARARDNYNRTRGGGSGPLTHRMSEQGKQIHQARMNRPEVKAQMRLLNLGNQRRLGTKGNEKQKQAVAASNRRRTHV